MPKNRNTRERDGGAVFRHPFSAAYWQAAVQEFSSLRKIALAAVFIAMNVVVSTVFVPVSPDGSLRILFSFLVKAADGYVCGPLIAFAGGGIADLLGFLLHPSGAFFPGYTLSAALGSMLYGLFLYRAPRVGLLRLFLAKASVNILINILLGCLWNAIIFGKAYYVYLAKSVVKNLVLLPLEVILLLLLFRVLVPALRRERLIPVQSEVALSRRHTTS